MADVYMAGDFRNGTTFEMDGNVFKVVEFQHVKPGKGSAFVRTKLKNVISGAVIEKTFNPSDKYAAAQIEKREMQYLYNDGNMYSFMNMNTYEQVEIDRSQISNEVKFLKEGLEVILYFYENEMLGIELPEKIDFKIIQTEPAVKGNTATNATKDAIIETGYLVKVPLFIEQDEEIIVSTKDGKYVSRK